MSPENKGRGRKSGLEDLYAFAVEAFCTSDDPEDLALRVDLTRKQIKTVFIFLDSGSLSETQRELGQKNESQTYRQVKAALKKTQKYLEAQSRLDK